MYTPEQLAQFNRSKAQAIYERFAETESTNQLNKAETGAEPVAEQYWTLEDLGRFKDDLIKGFEDGEISSEEVAKAKQDIESLVSATKDIDGVETEVFVKGVK